MGYETITNLGFKFVDGQENPSGIQEQAYLIPISWLTTEAKPIIGVTAESVVTIATDHILAATRAAIEVQPLFTKSGDIFKLSGEELSKIFENDVDFFVPQINAAALGSAAAIKNFRFMVLLRRVGQTVGFWQIGSKAMPAKVQDIPGGLGNGPTGEPGYRIQLKAFDIVPMYDYQGELPVAGI